MSHGHTNTQQGGSVANTFLKHNSDWHIRGITRSTTSEKVKTWADRGVELVKADQDDVESLKRAFTGASAIYAVTAYDASYSKICEDEEAQKRAKAEGKIIHELAAEMEITQGLNMAKAASDPDVLATLEKFVFSTLTAIKAISGRKYAHCCQFDSKAHVESRIREDFSELSKRLSTVNLGAYQENLKDMPEVFGPQKDDSGTFFFRRLKWPGPHQSHPEVIAHQDTGLFAEALILKHPPGTNVLGASQIVTKEEYAALWGRVVDRQATVKDISEDEFAKFMPEEFGDELLDFAKFITEFGYAGGNAAVKTPEELGIKTTPLEDFIRKEDWSSIL